MYHSAIAREKKFFRGSMMVARTLLADVHPQAIIIEINEETDTTK